MRSGAIVTALSGSIVAALAPAGSPSLWEAYDAAFRHAKYADLAHTIAPNVPVWHGFARSKFAATTNPATGKPYTYQHDGFEATDYDLATDQLGTHVPLYRIPKPLLSVSFIKLWTSPGWNVVILHSYRSKRRVFSA